MCGIAGVLGRRCPDDVIRMTGGLVHRGPDDEGFYTSPQATLGMRRLSIIDLISGRQFP